MILYVLGYTERGFGTSRRYRHATDGKIATKYKMIYAWIKVLGLPSRARHPHMVDAGSSSARSQ